MLKFEEFTEQRLSANNFPKLLDTLDTYLFVQQMRSGGLDPERQQNKVVLDNSLGSVKEGKLDSRIARLEMQNARLRIHIMEAQSFPDLSNSLDRELICDMFREDELHNSDVNVSVHGSVLSQMLEEHILI